MIQRSANFPPRLKSVTTLPCETLTTFFDLWTLNNHMHAVHWKNLFTLCKVVCDTLRMRWKICRPYLQNSFRILCVKVIQISSFLTSISKSNAVGLYVFWNTVYIYYTAKKLHAYVMMHFTIINIMNCPTPTVKSPYPVFCLLPLLFIVFIVRSHMCSSWCILHITNEMKWNMLPAKRSCQITFVTPEHLQDDLVIVSLIQKQVCTSSPVCTSSLPHHSQHFVIN